MGIVIKQSFLNTLVLFLGFAIGGINVLFLFTHFLHEDYFGLITFMLSTANILLPLLVFGMQHTVIKFFSAYTLKEDKDSFLIASLWVPLLVIIPLGLMGMVFYQTLAHWLSSENILIKKYTYLIFLVAVFMGYFEVFYAWTKVQFNSVFGNFIKEIFARVCTTILLFAVFFKFISNEQFIYATVIVYALRTVIMILYALTIYMPKFKIAIPPNFREILSFSFFILVAGSASGILLEIDKFMIPQLEQIAEVAYYSVGVYIASVIAIPTRAMQQITSPITAKDMNENNIVDVETLYKQTSINLLIVGGLFFLLINLNIHDLYALINKPQFTKGIWVVLIISISKIIELALGTGNAILINSKYYKIFFYVSLAMASSVVVLNKWLIELIGINGAALATLIVVLVYSFLKIVYIHLKLKIQPFTFKSLQIMLFLFLFLAGFWFVIFPFHPLINIALKSVLITLSYIFLVHKFNVSQDLSSALKKYIFKR